MILHEVDNISNVYCVSMVFDGLVTEQTLLEQI